MEVRVTDGLGNVVRCRILRSPQRPEPSLRLVRMQCRAFQAAHFGSSKPLLFCDVCHYKSSFQIYTIDLSLIEI